MGSYELLRHTFAEIHLENLRDNIKALQSHIDYQSFFCPMVKSNGYGHGDIEIVKILVEEGVRSVGVALVEEGIRLREHGFKDLNILVFGVTGIDGAEAMVANRLIPVISTFNQISEFARQASGESAPLPIHVKFNTGMFRLGFEVSEAEQVKDLLAKEPRLKLTGICSHLSDGEDVVESGGRTEEQEAQFSRLENIFCKQGVVSHLYNSAGYLGCIATHKEGHFLGRGVRPGIAVYGVFPALPEPLCKELIRTGLELKPVMTLKSEVVKYHHVAKGERVSYGGRWTAARNSIIGVVPIGYADGYSRAFSGRGLMLYRGKRVPVVGTVCMDYVMIDLTEILGDKLGNMGEEIVIFGVQNSQELSVSEVALLADTIPYELLTCIGRRVPRRYLTGCS